MPFEIDKKGRWITESLEGHCFDRKLALVLARFLKKKMQKNIVDLGCGPGWYVKVLRERGFIVEGYDGNPYTDSISKLILADGTNCRQADLSKRLRLDTMFDTVLSLEVGEHIPEKYEQIFFNNLSKNAINLVVLSWAIEGQEGSGHVNCRNNHYVIEQMTKRRFNFDKESTIYLRERATLPWFKDTIMVFFKDGIEHHS